MNMEVLFMSTNLLINQYENYYYQNKEEVIKYANDTTVEIMNLYDTYLRLQDYGIITELTPIFPYWQKFQIYLIDLLSLPNDYKILTESKIMDRVMPNEKEKIIPFYKYLFNTICYIEIFKVVHKDEANLKHYLLKLNEHSRKLNEAIDNIEKVFQGKKPVIKLFTY